MVRFQFDQIMRALKLSSSGKYKFGKRIKKKRKQIMLDHYKYAYSVFGSLNHSYIIIIHKDNFTRNTSESS